MKTADCGFKDLGNLTGSRHLQYTGPTLAVDIGFDPAYHSGIDEKPPVPSARGLGALVDTGAQNCCIDATLAMQLQLPIIDQIQVCGVDGTSKKNVHMAQVYVPALDYTIMGHFVGADLTGGGQPHQAILGRDFLKHFKLIYDGRTGKVVIQDA